MTALRGQAGFTLAELLVAMVLAALILAGATAAFQTGSQIVVASARQAEAQQGARWALDRMIEEIRGAGYDPAVDLTTVPPTHNFSAISNQSVTSLTLQNDWNGNKLIDPVGCTWLPSEQIRYQLAGTNLNRSSNLGNAACDETVTTGVQALTFTYLQENNTVTAVAGNIRTVVVSITVRSGTGASARSVTMVSRVRLRNR